MQSLPKSDTRATETVPGDKSKVRAQHVKASDASHENADLETRNSNAACMAAAVDLEKSRVLIAALDVENSLLSGRLNTEKRTTSILLELSETRKSETEGLRNVIAAKNETLTAKDVVAASQDNLIAALKSKKTSPWRRLGDILIGVAAGAILR